MFVYEQIDKEFFIQITNMKNILQTFQHVTDFMLLFWNINIVAMATCIRFKSFHNKRSVGFSFC